MQNFVLRDFIHETFFCYMKYIMIMMRFNDEKNYLMRKADHPPRFLCLKATNCVIFVNKCEKNTYNYLCLYKNNYYKDTYLGTDSHI